MKTSKQVLSASNFNTNLTFSQVLYFQDITDEVKVFFLSNNHEFYPVLFPDQPALEIFLKETFFNSGRLIVCRNGNQIAGVIGLELTHPEWGSYISIIIISTTCRRMGVADLLFDAAEHVFSSNGVAKVFVKTWSLNVKSPGLFVKHNFIHVLTLTNQRGNDVHTFYFVKILYYLPLSVPVTGLSVFTDSGAIGKFLCTLASFPSSKYKRGRLLPVTIYPADMNSLYLTDQPICTSSHLLSLTGCEFSQAFRVKDVTTEYMNIWQLALYLMRKQGQDYKWLMVSLECYEEKAFAGLKCCLLNREERTYVGSIVAQVSLGAEPSHYAECIAGIAKQNGCNALAILDLDLHQMFGFRTFYKDLYILDPFNEIALLLESVKVVVP